MKNINSMNLYLKLNKIIKIKNRVEYLYEYSKELDKFFNKKQNLFVEYNISVEDVPDNILVIPFLSNMATISWFVGFDIYVSSIDKDFYHSLLDIKKEFEIHYPEIKNKNTFLHSDELVQNNKIRTDKSAMLFSGGIDAFATFFRHKKDHLDLVTIKGADIDITDDKQWNSLCSYNENTSVLKDYDKYYIQSNIRKFYTFEVNKLLPNLSWWGYIQHGLSLICLLSPLSFINGYSKIYIASSCSSYMDLSAWGSMPQIDEKITWAGTTVIHDGYELKRQDKVDLIVSNAQNNGHDFRLRVCYSETNTDLNCSHCEKCYRSILGILICGENPNLYGFSADQNIYVQIKNSIRGFKTEVTRYFWKEIVDKAKESEPFIFSDSQKEIELLQFKDLITYLEKICQKDLAKTSKFQKNKYWLIDKYPYLFNKYLKIRRKFLK